MIDWDDVRYFLAVARGGSVQAAAKHLEVNHATVLRRVAQLEKRLEVQMFEKLPSGHHLTAAGDEVLELANQMEASSHQLESRVLGRDQRVHGLLRVTLPPPLAGYLLMPDFADFARLHPGIEVDILPSGELANLTNREADVAIRVVYAREALPLNLHGAKGPDLFGGFYMSRDRLAEWRAGPPDPRWIAIRGHGVPDWSREGEARAAGVPFRTTDFQAQVAAVRQGIGITAFAVFRRRCRPGVGESPRYRLAPVRIDLASHLRGNPQDQAGTAVHGVPVPQADRLCAAARRPVPAACLSRVASIRNAPAA